MLRDLHPTTRRYPRTTTEAFPDKIENAEWFYPPERSAQARDIALGVIGCVLWVGLLYILVRG